MALRELFDMNFHDLSGKFEPDPNYKLDPEVKARVIPIYDADALEFFLSAFPYETRATLLDEFFHNTWCGEQINSTVRWTRHK